MVRSRCGIAPDASGHVDIPSDWQKVSSESFYGCKKLISVTIPSNIKLIESRAFQNCQNLVEVDIADGGVHHIKSSAFEYCKSLKTVNLGDSVKEIEKFSFKACQSLTSFVLPEPVEILGQGAFQLSTGLKNVTMNSKLTRLEKKTFEGCSALETFDFGNVTALGYAAFKSSGFFSMSIPETIVRLNDSVFSSCTRLVEVVIPGSIEEIGQEAFAHSYNIAKITIKNGVKKIRQSAFTYMGNLQELDLPPSVNVIEPLAFMWNSMNRVIIQGQSVRIGEGSFAHCALLTNVTFVGTEEIFFAKTAFTYSTNAFIYLQKDLKLMTGYEPVTCTDDECMCTPGYGDPYLDSNGNIFTCRSCEVGYTSKGTQGACVPCQAGRYAASEETKECTPCAEGMFSAKEGSTSVDDCSPCEAGTYAPAPGSSACVDCPPGNYCRRPKLSFYSPCKPGTYSSKNGQLSCLSCDEGKFAASNGSAVCEGCPRGTYLEFTGASLESMCLSCPAGRYGDKTGLGACFTCTPGNYCPRPGLERYLQCEPGTFTSTEAQILCQDCGVGKYSAKNGSAVCEDCPTGTYLDVGGASKNTSCLACPGGTFGNKMGLDQCEVCPAGYYQSKKGQSTCLDCKLQGKLMTNTPDYESCVLNSALLSESMADMLFSDGVALIVGFIITAAFAMICAGMQYLREKQPLELGQLQRWQVLVKSALPGFNFGSEFMLIIGIFAGAPKLAGMLIMFRLMHLVTCIFIFICLFGHQWTRPYIAAMAKSIGIEDADEWRSSVHFTFAKANIPIVGAVLILCMTDVSIVQMLPWNASQFYRDSTGFPRKSIMRLCLGMDAFQAIASVICQLIYLVSYAKHDATTKPQAKALFGLNITTSLLTVVMGMVMVLLKERLLKERGHTNQYKNGDEDKEADIIPEKEVGDDKNDKGRRTSVTLELGNVYSNGDEGSARIFNNPMHTENKDDDIESCNPMYTEYIEGAEKKEEDPDIIENVEAISSSQIRRLQLENERLRAQLSTHSDSGDRSHTIHTENSHDNHDTDINL